jgi:flagellar hook-length control protein FliK
MARLNLENLSGLLAMETMLSPLAPSGSAAGQDAFDEHLLRAQTAATPAAPEDYGRRDAGYGPSPERRAAEPRPSASDRDDTRRESGGSASDAPGPSEAQDDLSRGPVTTDSESPTPEESQDDASGPEAAAAGEPGSAASAKPTSDADRAGGEDASEKVEHQDQIHPAARRSKTGKTAGKEPAGAEGNVQGEPAADAAPGGRAKQPAEAQAAGASDGSQPAKEAGAETADAKPGESGGPQDAAASASQSAEAQAAVQAAATASPTGGPRETAPAPAEVLPAPTLDGLTSTQAPGPDPRHGPSRAGAKGSGPSHPAAVEPDVQPAAEKPDAAQEVKPVAASPVPSDLASAAAATGKPDMAQGNPADGPAAAADPAATKQGERAARPAGAERAPGSEQADRVRFVQRVARAFESAAERGGTVRLRLHPPELGSLRIELTVRDGRMNARLEAETEAARNLIVDNLPALRQRLAEHQIRVERFDVDWGGRPTGNLPQHSQDGAGRQPGRAGFKPLSEAGSRGGAAAPPVPQAMPRPGDGGRFDVVI